MAGSEHAGIEFQLAGFMHGKLPERVHGMRRFCDDVRTRLRKSPGALQLMSRFTKIRILVTVDDIPLPPARDQVDPEGSAVLYMQTVGPRDGGDDLFPDFVFGGWWHIGLHDFDAFATAMDRNAPVAPIHKQAFWIGNPEMHASRRSLLALSTQHPGHIDARAIRWRHDLGNVSELTGDRAKTDGGWVSLQDHTRWRYLIDMPGTGWSGRLKLLPHCGRPLLLPPRDHWDWASSKLEPGVHYISIKDDLSDLIPAIDALNGNQSHANMIAASALKLAHESLTYRSARDHAVTLVMRRLRNLVSPHRKPLVSIGASPSRDGQSETGERAKRTPRWDARLRKSAQRRQGTEHGLGTVSHYTTAALRSVASVPTEYRVLGEVVAIHPISNSLPDSVFVSELPPKETSYFAFNMPGNKSTYIFENESSYLEHYRASYYGVTRKKTGWDCGRHLEIMASGAIPYFIDLDALPPRTLALYPRDAIRAAMNLPGVSVAREDVKPGLWYLQRERFKVDQTLFDETQYNKLAAEILDHAREHLSSSGMASYMLQTLGLTIERASPVLFVTHCSQDFTGDALLYGLQKLAGPASVVDVAFDSDGGFQHPWCDDTSRHQSTKPYLRQTPAATAHGGPMRFSIHGKHAASASVLRDELPQRLNAREFGLIVFGSASRTTGGLLEVAAAAGYARDRIVLIYGEDMPYPLHKGWPMEGVQRPPHTPPTVPSIVNASRMGTIFQRELYDEPVSLPHTHQTIMVPGIADQTERGMQKAFRIMLPSQNERLPPPE